MFTFHHVTLTALRIAAALASLAVAAQAQAQAQAVTGADPAKATAVTPALTYRSVFTSYQPAPTDDVAADQHWRSANAQVSQLGGHAGHLQAAPSNAVTAPASGMKEITGNHAHQSQHPQHHHGGGH